MSGYSFTGLGINALSPRSENKLGPSIGEYEIKSEYLKSLRLKELSIKLHSVKTITCSNFFPHLKLKASP